MAANYSLTKFEREFAIRFMECGDQVSAYRIVYANKIQRMNLSDNTVKMGAAKLLQNPDIVGFIQEVRAEVSGTALVDLQQLVIDLAHIATTDINEICQVRRECCRHCYGIDHHHQWAAWELERDTEAYKQDYAKWVRKGSVPDDEPPEPDDRGGTGWNPHREPNPECPRCYGDGKLHTWVADSRTLSPAARKLYNGFEWDKNGNMKVLLKSQEEAQAKLLRIFGAWSPTREMSPAKVREAADKVSERSIVINLVDSPDA